ncbi:ankyrin repeat domain-containing protein, partial [Aliarcobacter butzleri]
IKEAYNESPIHTLVSLLNKDDVIIDYLEYCWNKEPFDVLRKNEMNSDILTNAAMSCHNKVIKWLVDKGADIQVIGG